MADLPTKSLMISRYWEKKALKDMSQEEWEALCDGCGQCCILILEDEEEQDDGYLETNVCCKLFDPITRRCTSYESRLEKVPGCVQVSPENADDLKWMPHSCAYRRMADGRGLADWHPLITGRMESVTEAGVAVTSDLVSERKVKMRHIWRHVTGRRDT